MDDADPGSTILKLVLLFLLIMVNALFAMSEIAIISLNDTKLQKQAESGNKKAAQILKLISNSSGFPPPWQLRALPSHWPMPLDARRLRM